MTVMTVMLSISRRGSCLPLIACLLVCGCQTVGPGSDAELTRDDAQRLVDEYCVDIKLVVGEVHNEGARGVATVHAGNYPSVEVVFAAADEGWRVDGFLFDGRPLPEAARGLVGRSIVYGIEGLRARNTMDGMRYLAEALEAMRTGSGAYPSSLEELAELGYMDRIQLDGIVNRANDMAALREVAPEYFPVGALVDGWGNPWQYELGTEGYRLLSTGSDGVPGPAVSSLQIPFDADLLLVNGEIVQAPDLR